MQTSMLYTMGMALDRAAENGTPVRLLVDSYWIEGRVAAVDTLGVVLEGEDGQHSVVRVDRISAVTVHASSPVRPSLPKVTPMAGARCG